MPDSASLAICPIRRAESLGIILRVDDIDTRIRHASGRTIVANQKFSGILDLEHPAVAELPVGVAEADDFAFLPVAADTECLFDRCFRTGKAVCLGGPF